MSEFNYPPGSPHPTDDVEALTIDCPDCGSPEGEMCVNPITSSPRHIPCIQRIREAGA